ncbi:MULTISPECIES: hypothetical protein [unclassified Microcoleus]|uniref:hypothetical protein n=1 Tax=unclassified Microcoleus TaxID=2642155 RepID=UPI002FCF5B26
MRHSRTLTLKRKTLDADAPYASPLNAEQLNAGYETYRGRLNPNTIVIREGGAIAINDLS